MNQEQYKSIDGLDAQATSWSVHLDLLLSFAKRIQASLKELGIQEKCSEFDIDHLCIRSDTAQEADALCADIKKVGKQISDLHIHGRKIRVYALDQPLKLGQWDVPCVEVPYPKPSKAYPAGWEHAEFVIPCEENTLEGVRASLFDIFPHMDDSEYQEKYGYYEDPPPTDEDLIPNPTIVFNVNGIGIKFHANSIKAIKEANKNDSVNH